jgi:hypothetical protein
MMKNTLRKILLSQLGVSLVELLISVGMMGGVALTVTELMRQNTQVTSKTRTRFDESEFIMMLHAKLSQPAICEKNFPVGAAAAKASFTNDRLLDTDDSVLAEVGTVYGENQDLTISSISSSYEATSSWIKVNIEFTKAKTNLGVQTITRSLMLFAEVDGSGNVERCLGSSLSVEDSGWDLACTNNTSAGGRNVMVTLTDPDDPTQTLCIKKALNVEGCGLLSTELAHSFTYNSSTKLYDFTCVAGFASTLCSPYFMMRYASDGTAVCDPIGRIQAYQPFNFTDNDGVFMSGPATLDCTGRNYLGLQNIDDQIRVMCDVGAADTPTPTATATATNTPTATPTGGIEIVAVGCMCRSTNPGYDWPMGINITKDIIPDDATTKMYVVLDSDCDGGPPSTAWTEGPSCTQSSDNGYLTCGLSITNSGGPTGTYTFRNHSVYPKVATNTVNGARCGEILYSGAIADGTNIQLILVLQALGPIKCTIDDSGAYAGLSGDIWSNDSYMSLYSPAVWYNAVDPVNARCQKGLGTLVTAEEAGGK